MMYRAKAANSNKTCSNEAASYDAKHEKTLGQIVEQIRSRLDFIGVDWVDDDEDEDGDGDDTDDKQSSKESGQTTPEKVVRLLDYACGTGVGRFRLSFLPIFSFKAIATGLCLVIISSS